MERCGVDRCWGMSWTDRLSVVWRCGAVWRGVVWIGVGGGPGLTVCLWCGEVWRCGVERCWGRSWTDRLSALGLPLGRRGRDTGTGRETCGNTRVAPAGIVSCTAGQAMTGLPMKEVESAMTTDLQATAETLYLSVVWNDVVWYGEVWIGAVWYGEVWSGAVWYGEVWSGAERCGSVRCGVERCGEVWSGAERCGAVWNGAVWYGECVGYGDGVGECVRVWCGAVVESDVVLEMVVVWRGVVRCGMERCGVVWSGAERCGVERCGVDRCDDRRSYPDERPPPSASLPPPPPPAPRVEKKPETKNVEDILKPPGRATRPDRIVVVMRGLPGSGKSHLAKLIRDKEVECGGAPPRVLGLDDYFMTEVEKEERDPDTGKRVKTKVLEYEYEPEMEDTYRTSMLKTFKKTPERTRQAFLLPLHHHRRHVQNVYLAEISADHQMCAKRNIHGWKLKDITKLANSWESAPVHMARLDIRSLLQDAAIEEVEMEDFNPAEVESQAEEKKEEEEELDLVGQSFLFKCLCV
ncbi:hypothetical protein NFI96_017555 [Prochilodus magdalenae]|nr:hypothetical protein NFI96_017555 [Prochilodus magdalenae]